MRLLYTPIVRGLDQSLFHWVNRWPDWLAPLMSFFSEGIKTTLVRALLAAAVVAMLAAGKTTRKAAVLAIVAWPLANGLTEALKHGFPMERPSVDLADAIVRGSHLTSSGTASSHAANMAAVAFVFTRHLGWWGVPWVLVAILTGLSRAYNGVHYPTQVLLGWLCGAFCGFLVVRTWEAWVALRTGRIEQSNGF